ncbi:SAICAR synthase-like protein [Phellopilus nigrolimitatus]|nr:SAICAR synthase-like protein [Phellopilus nigrolimitatus]
MSGPPPPVSPPPQPTAPSPDPGALRALAAQVGGHPGVLATADGALVVKPCLPRERAFYALLARGDPRAARLRPFAPLFYGTLRLEGRVPDAGAGALAALGGVAAVAAAADAEQGLVPAPEDANKDECSGTRSIVLENVASAFATPNILDIKLGTVLYDDAAGPEKKARMLEAARKTTSLATGVRLTGFQVYDPAAGAPAITPKSYGKALTAGDLPAGVRRFFPRAPDDDGAPAGPGLPRALLLPVLAGVLADVRAVRAALAATELRMVGASLLVVYEADCARARAALESAAAVREREDTGNGEMDLDAEGEEDEEEEGEDEDDLESDEEEEECPLYAVKLIDFAHTRLAPGEGPDEGVLKGLDTTIRLLEGRIKEVESP